MHLNQPFALVCFLLCISASAFSQDLPSPFGPDDTIGAANHLSAEYFVEAAKLVKTGKTYSLGVITGPETPAPLSRWTKMVISPLGPRGENKLTGHEDLLISHLGLGSQLDSLSHIGINGVHYNNNKASDFGTPSGVTKLGAEHVPPIVTRGVLIDMAKKFGKRSLKPGDVFNSADIKAAAATQGITIQKGDVVLFHNGWMNMAKKDGKKTSFDAPGLGVDGTEWLAERGVVAVGADTAGVEVTPPENPKESGPVHIVLLVENGVYILENMNTADLAADEAYEFLLVLGQPKFAGSVQAVINPIAIR